MANQEERLNRWHRELGEIITLMLQTPAYSRYPIGSIGAWIQPAIFHQQARVFRDTRDVPVGYVTWAFLSPEVAVACSAQANRILHFSEWNEGDQLWLMDFLALPGWGRHLVNAIKNELFPCEACIRWARTKRQGLTLKTYYRRERARRNHAPFEYGP